MNKLLQFINSDLHVIIFGKHSQSWMNALGPDAKVWLSIPKVSKVILSDIGSPTINNYKKVRNKIIIPLMEEHIASCPEDLPRLIPNKEALEIFSDKSKFHHYTITHNLSENCPETYKNVTEAKFPCILKRTDLNAGRGIVIANSLEEIHDYLKQDLWKNKKYIIQSFIAGESEYVSHCVCKNGAIIWNCTYLYTGIPSYGIRDHNIGIRPQKSSISQEHIKILESFLLPLNYSGPCNIDYKIDEAGKLKIFEINPRLGGSLMLEENIDDLKNTLEIIIENAQKNLKNPFLNVLDKIKFSLKTLGL